MEKRMLSLEEAFKELSRKPVRKLNEAKEENNLKVFDAKKDTDFYYDTFFIEELNRYAKDISNGDIDENADEVLQYYLDKKLPKKDLLVIKAYTPLDGYKDKYTFNVDFGSFGFKLANGDYLYTTESIQEPIYIKCKDYNSMRNYIINDSVDYDAESFVESLNEAKKKVNEALEHINLQKHAKGLWDEDGYGEIASGNEEEFFNRYAKDPVVVKYSSKKIYDEILSSDKILEMIGEDFGDGEGEPTAFIFSWKGKVAYMNLNSNDASFTPSISFSDFKKIVSGWDLPWCEIGFGNFSDNNYGYVTIKDAIKDCEVNNQVYFWSKESSLYVDEDK